MKGWYNTRFNVFLEAFKKQQEPAPSAEIGVFHGKSFIPIYHRRSYGMPVLAIDIWEPVKLPNWTAYKGNRLLDFQANVKKHIKHPGDIVIMSGNSRDMTATDYLEKAGGKIRVFHIDGDHNMEGCLHDMLQVEQCLTDDGIMVLDDVFNPGWPGVSAAANEFLRHAHQTDIAPVMIGAGKTVLSRKRDWQLPKPLSWQPWHNAEACPIYRY